MLLLAIPVTAAGQPARASRGCGPLLDALRNAPPGPARSAAATALARTHNRPPCLAEILLQDAVERTQFGEFIKRLESRRTDKQAGSSAGTGGSTNLVSKGTTAKVLSFAAEYGALTESVNKQVVTVQGSLDGLPAALVRHQVLPYCPTSAPAPECVHRRLFESLRRFSYGVSFDTSETAQGVTGTASDGSRDAAPATFTARGRSITAVTARAVLVNSRDDASTVFHSAWVKAMKQQPPELGEAADKLLASMQSLLDLVENMPEYGPWQRDTVAALERAPNDAIDAVWLERAHVLAGIVRLEDPSATKLADAFVKAGVVYRFEQDQLVAAIAEKPVLTLQYDYKHAAAHPSTSTMRLVFDKGFRRVWSFAVNGAVELYDQKPSADIPDAGHVRDAQFAVQVQRDLGTLAFLGSAAVSGAYYFQYQQSPAILEVEPGAPLPGITFTTFPPAATEVFAAKGHLHVAQLRLVLGPSGSSARFPIAISYSNRTELVTRPVLRGEIGVSYDFDSLFAR